jgi:hypothetical protein
MSTRVQERRWSLAVRFTVAALVWSVGLVLAALFVSSYHGETSSSVNGLSLHSSTLVQVHGLSALVLVAVPVIASLLVGGALWRRHRAGDAWSERLAWLVIAALAIVAVLAITYVGAFMIPVVVLLGLSSRLVRTPPGVSGSASASVAAES